MENQLMSTEPPHTGQGPNRYQELKMLIDGACAARYYLKVYPHLVTGDEESEDLRKLRSELAQLETVTIHGSGGDRGEANDRNLEADFPHRIPDYQNPTLKELRDAVRDLGSGKHDAGALEAYLATFLRTEALADEERAFLAVCQLIRRRNDGDRTPGEQLIVQLVNGYAREALKPPGVIDATVRFTAGYQALVRSAERMLSDYPELVCLADGSVDIEKLMNGGGATATLQ